MLQIISGNIDQFFTVNHIHKMPNTIRIRNGQLCVYVYLAS